MSTLAVVEQILRETRIPMTVRQIVERAGSRLPSKSKTPDTVVARDLSMDIKRKQLDSRFVRTSPGLYTMREFAPPEMPVLTTPVDATPILAGLRTERAAPVPASMVGSMATRMVDNELVG